MYQPELRREVCSDGERELQNTDLRSPFTASSLLLMEAISERRNWIRASMEAYVPESAASEISVDLRRRLKMQEGRPWK